MTKIILAIIVLLAASLRLYGLNWDQGYHLHPDERMITMVATRVHLPVSPEEQQNLFTPESPLNPKFFAYGSFPLYLLAASGNLAGQILNPLFAAYDSINLVGRFLSALFDIGTLLILYLIGKNLINQKVGILAAFLYSISVLPIQLSHFYAVDTPLTFFVLLTLYQLLNFYGKPNFKNATLVGIFFGFSLATKISATLLIVSIGTAILADFILILIKNPHHPNIWLPYLPKTIRRLFLEGGLIVIITLITFLLLEPFALIDFQTFWQQTLEQQKMTKDAFTFPYTLQYVGKIPYFYELKNIFFFGLGPTLAMLSFLGIALLTIQTLMKEKLANSWAKELILLVYCLTYFLIVGSFAIGFMRYTLPLYPLLILGAAFILEKIFLYFQKNLPKPLLITSHLLLLTFLLIWPLSFTAIYSKPNTRVVATNWIKENIPPGSTIATEHWDDGLPIERQSDYQVLELPMYDSDENPEKWVKIKQVLNKTDYIIIASNRLYTPLMRLTDCPKLPSGKCYQKTAEYYKNLFNDSLGFNKVIEFAAYPQLTSPVYDMLYTVYDSSADESFTVYDHPKIMIFRKII